MAHDAVLVPEVASNGICVDFISVGIMVIKLDPEVVYVNPGSKIIFILVVVGELLLIPSILQNDHPLGLEHDSL